MSISAGAIVLVEFPFTDATGQKTRPALVLFVYDADTILARITSSLAAQPEGVGLKDWEKSNLLKPSQVLLNRLHTVAEDRIKRQIGQVSSGDWTAIRETWNSRMKLE